LKEAFLIGHILRHKGLLRDVAEEKLMGTVTRGRNRTVLLRVCDEKWNLGTVKRLNVRQNSME